MNNNFKVVSLFSGCGGLDLGFLGNFTFKKKKYTKNKFKIVFANDFDSDAVNTYNKNTLFFNDHTIKKQNILKVPNEEIPSFDVLLAGFPCQPFSNAGKRQGILDDNGRGTLFYECYRILEAGRQNNNGALPKAFIFENVRGIMSSKVENGRTVPEEIKIRMENIGYNISMKLIRCSDYGVPQNRYRYIIIGIRKDLKPFNFTILDEIAQEYHIPTYQKNYQSLTLGHILCDIPEDCPQKNEFWRYSPQGQDIVDMIGPCNDGKEALQLFANNVPFTRISDTITKGRSWKNIPPDNLPPRLKKIFDDPKKYHSPNFYRRFALGEIAGTITASAQPEKSGITHPFENRRFTIREIARIQSFPDEFIFPYTAIQNAYKVIGNAVPPVFSWVLAKALEKHLSSQ